MADVLVYNNAYQNSSMRAMRAPVMVSASVGYIIHCDNTDFDLYYTKTTDGGQTWGAKVSIDTGTTPAFDVWYDKWTPGDSGTLIHIAWIAASTHDVMYRTLDTASDTLGTERTAFDGASAVVAEMFVTTAKARGGNLYIAYDLDGGTEVGFLRSVDAGENWTARAAGIIEAAPDKFALFPGNEADNQDMYLVYLDDSADELSLKVYDDSGDTSAETAIAAHAYATGDDDTKGVGFSGSVRHSDGHLILVQANAFDAATTDWLCWDINGAASITAKTNLTTDIDDIYNPAVFINQATGRIYVASNGKADGTETIGTSTGIYYWFSGDGGTTWSEQQTYTETNRDYHSLYVDLGGTSTRFLPVAYDDTNRDLYVNYLNSIAVGSASSPGNSGNAPGRGRGGGNGGGGNNGGGGTGGGGNPVGNPTRALRPLRRRSR